jgi:lambda repressor-like predicted transcriptional regulator
MSDIAKGTLVHHASLGVGKVVAVEPTALHVFFPGAERRFAAKLRLPAAKLLLRTDGVERDSWLEGLSSFTLDPDAGRYALAASWMTHEQAIAQFLGDFPQGFADPSYLAVTGAAARRARAPRWRAAVAEWSEVMGEGARLAADGEVRELVKRALRVEKHVALVPGMFESGAIREALQDPDAAGPFFRALFDVLGAPPARARLEKLFVAADALDVEPALAWPIATVFLFVADPARHVFLWPRTACAAAERLGCDLKYDPTPNALTYGALRTLSAQLLAELQPTGARDFVDVEAFLHTTASARASGAEATGRRKRTAPRAVASRSER